jgi:exoribonuclease R
MNQLNNQQKHILNKTNNQFNWYFNKIYLPKYNKGVIDLPEYNMSESHAWAIQNRTDFKHTCITVDPEYCIDADDGFSVYSETMLTPDGAVDKLYLAIHIADPTHYIPHDSELFQVICQNVTTQYPSMNQSIHLMPRDVIDESSLISSVSEGEKKNAITIITEIDQTTYLPIGLTEIQFTRVLVTPHDRFAYEQAALYLLSPDEFKIELEHLKSVNVDNKKRHVHAFNIALSISKALRDSRTSIGKTLEHFHSIIKYNGGTSHLYEDPDNVKDMKSIIAEFAIFSNSFIGDYLNTNVDSTLGIYRTCNTDDLEKEVNSSNPDGISGTELFDKIIKTSTSASYTQTNNSHGLVGASKYTHFTSPIRRASDCICHYLVKYIYHCLHNMDKKIKKPFTNNQLNNLIIHIDQKSKFVRKLHYADTKFRTIHAISNLVLTNGFAMLHIKFIGYIGTYLNFSIKRVNDFFTSVSYTLCIKNYPPECVDYLTNFNNIPEYPEISGLIPFNIMHVNIPKKYDVGTFPEFDSYINWLQCQID